MENPESHGQIAAILQDFARPLASYSQLLAGTTLLDTPRLNPELEGGSSTFKIFEVDVVGWLWYDRETTPFVLLPGLHRELLLLW